MKSARMQEVKLWALDWNGTSSKDTTPGLGQDMRKAGGWGEKQHCAKARSSVEAKGMTNPGATSNDENGKQ